MLSQLVCEVVWVGDDQLIDYQNRTMPTTIEDGALQRVAGGEEQGREQVVWQVLGVAHRILHMFF